MNYEYKFIKVRTNQPVEEVTDILNSLGKDGWKLINFHPTSDNEMGKVRGGFYKVEAWDVGYVFTFIREIN